MCGFQFGAIELWLDRVPTMSQAEIRLQIDTPDARAAGEHLEKEGVIRCDEIEPVPDGFKGFWISSPASIVHLVSQADK